MGTQWGRDHVTVRYQRELHPIDGGRQNTGPPFWLVGGLVIVVAAVMWLTLHLLWWVAGLVARWWVGL
jgi:hypothetical protein